MLIQTIINDYFPKVEETSLVVYQAPKVEEEETYQRCPFACNDTRKHILSFLYGDEGPIMMPPVSIMAKALDCFIELPEEYYDTEDEMQLVKMEDQACRNFFKEIPKTCYVAKKDYMERALTFMHDMHECFIEGIDGLDDDTYRAQGVIDVDDYYISFFMEDEYTCDYDADFHWRNEDWGIEAIDYAVEAWVEGLDEWKVLQRIDGG